MYADRHALAARLVVALYLASRRNPSSWRRASAIGKAAGIEDPEQLEQAVSDAVRAGLMERQDGGDSVVLTDKGRRLAGQRQA